MGFSLRATPCLDGLRIFCGTTRLNSFKQCSYQLRLGPSVHPYVARFPCSTLTNPRLLKYDNMQGPKPWIQPPRQDGSGESAMDVAAQALPGVSSGNVYSEPFLSLPDLMDLDFQHEAWSFVKDPAGEGCESFAVLHASMACSQCSYPLHLIDPSICLSRKCPSNSQACLIIRSHTAIAIAITKLIRAAKQKASHLKASNLLFFPHFLSTAPSLLMIDVQGPEPSTLPSHGDSSGGSAMDIAAPLLAATSGGANLSDSRLDSAAAQSMDLDTNQEAVPGAQVSEEHPAGMGSASFAGLVRHYASFAVLHASTASHACTYPLHLDPCASICLRAPVFCFHALSSVILHL